MEPSAELPVAPRTFQFRNESVQARKPRILPNEWDKFKDIILEQFHSSGLPDTKEYMQREHGFVAELWQYKHQIYKRWPKANGKSTSMSPSTEEEMALPSKQNSSTTTDWEEHTRSSVRQPDHLMLNQKVSTSSLPSYQASLGRSRTPTSAGSSQSSRFQERITPPSSTASVDHGTSKRPASPSLISSSTPNGSKIYKKSRFGESLPNNRRFSVFFDTTSNELLSNELSPFLTNPSTDLGAGSSNFGTGMSLGRPVLVCSPAWGANRKVVVDYDSNQTELETLIKVESTVARWNGPAEYSSSEYRISALAWEDVSRLMLTGDFYATCSLFESAFRLHWITWQWLSKPWKPERDCTARFELLERALIACARSARTTKSLETVRNMLEHTLEDGVSKLWREIRGRDSFVLRILLAEVCKALGDEDAEAQHLMRAKHFMSTHVQRWSNDDSKEGQQLGILRYHHSLRSLAFHRFLSNRHVVSRRSVHRDEIQTSVMADIEVLKLLAMKQISVSQHMVELNRMHDIYHMIEWSVKKLRSWMQREGADWTLGADSIKILFEEDKKDGFLIFLYLWEQWVQECGNRTSDNCGSLKSANWAYNVERTLGISATEMLSVVATAISKYIPETPISRTTFGSTDLNLSQAVAGAEALFELSQEILFDSIQGSFAAHERRDASIKSLRRLTQLTHAEASSRAQRVLGLEILSGPSDMNAVPRSTNVLTVPDEIRVSFAPRSSTASSKFDADPTLSFSGESLQPIPRGSPSVISRGSGHSNSRVSATSRSPAASSIWRQTFRNPITSMDGLSDSISILRISDGAWSYRNSGVSGSHDSAHIPVDPQIVNGVYAYAKALLNESARTCYRLGPKVDTSGGWVPKSPRRQSLDRVKSWFVPHRAVPSFPHRDIDEWLSHSFGEMNDDDDDDDDDDGSFQQTSAAYGAINRSIGTSETDARNTSLRH